MRNEFQHDLKRGEGVKAGLITGSCNFLVKHFQTKKLKIGSAIHEPFVCFDFVNGPFDWTFGVDLNWRELKPKSKRI